MSVVYAWMIDHNAAPVSKAYCPSHMVDYNQFTYYYAYGNTPAEDLLKHVHFKGVREPTILSLSRGNIRSCFYTTFIFIFLNLFDFTAATAADTPALSARAGWKKEKKE